MMLTTLRPTSRTTTRTALSAAVLALALLASACAGSTGTTGSSGADGSADSSAVSSVEVRPFEEIQDSAEVFEADPLDPSAGIYRVTTTVPTICAIVWGETEDLGRFNNSLAMSGTGIVQHDVVLPDLEQGREYFYVVQGTDADGTLFRSEMSTFTIPVTETADAEPEPDLGENLAADGTTTVAEASSEFNDSFAAGNAIDGDLRSEWSSSDDGDEAFITLDLGGSVEVTGVAFLTRSMADGTAITETFTATTDDGEVLGPFPAGSPAQARIAEVAATTSTLRFEVDTSTGGNVGAVEVQVFGTRTG